jgi:hypothetical protein
VTRSGAVGTRASAAVLGCSWKAPDLKPVEIEPNAKMLSLKRMSAPTR